MENVQAIAVEEHVQSLNKGGKGFPIFQATCRAAAAIATFAAALLMGLNEQRVALPGGFEYFANYKFSPAFEFFLYGNAVASAYSLLAVPFITLFGSTFFMHFLDMVMMGLVMGSAAGAAAIGYVGKYGNDHTYWTKVCNFTDKFCKVSEWALGCSFVGFVFMFMVCTLSSAHRIRKN